jgi:hypothetical protein
LSEMKDSWFASRKHTDEYSLQAELQFAY